jgi:DUF4097 and DUF4098 domain-containing protein YvlB
MSILAGIMTVVLLFSTFGVDTLFADTLERVFPAAKTVRVSAESASIELIGNEDNQIELDIECKKDISNHYEISSELENGVLLINVKRKKDGFKLFGISRSPSIKLSLAVPFQTACTLKTSGGSIDACSLDASLAVNTSGGSISCSNVRGEVDLKTSGGSVNCRSIAGNLDAKTSGGPIKLKDSTGKAVLRTSGGSIGVYGQEGAIDAHTSGGGIKVELASSPIGDCHLQTSGGGITLSLPESSDANLYAKTSGGSVRTDIPLTVTASGKQARNKLEGKFGRGGPSVTLKTSGGGIRIVKNDS